MYWLFLPFALGAFILAFSTPYMWLLVVSLLVALGFMLAWARGWYAAKIGDASQRDALPMIDPVELRRLREQAEARRHAAAAANNDASTP
ncbi:hypothetical protein [Xanthomonas sp. GPE 39]|uniref:hypothetical protein n=1 Tax=Xanthomonas sp. GPE 39 TaxID=1583099 RepID=UPI0005F2C283|nr:hypothetical protein [Xanthomonas sp. GPE 39]